MATGLMVDVLTRLDLSSNKVPCQLSLPLTPPPEDEYDYLCKTAGPFDPPILETNPHFTPVVAVIGVGYVGLHLVEAFSRRYDVIAFDVSEQRLQQISEHFAGLPVQCTSRPNDLAAADYFLISVPTVLNHDKTIDTTYLKKAVQTINRYAKHGVTVVVESSVAVGMTRALLSPLIATKNVKIGMSPEVSLSMPP